MSQWSIALTVIILCVVASAAVAGGNVVTYPVPDAMKDCQYSVMVDGVEVPIEKAGGYNGAYYARFEYKDKVSVEVKVKTTASTTVTLKPERFRTDLTGEGNVIGFSVNKPGPRVITTICGSTPLWPLIIFAEEAGKRAPVARDSKTIEVKKYLKGKGIQTKNIQKALDDCAAKGGGMVYFEPGVYSTGPIYIRDNTTVYLAPGCLIQGSANPKDYDGVPNRYNSYGPTTGLNSLINFDKCKNSKLIGQGVIEGAGHILRNSYGLQLALLTVIESQNIQFEDVVLRNSPCWTVHFLGSNGIKVDGMKIVNDWSVGNTDGINPDCSNNVEICNYFGFCGDDGVTVKATSDSDKLTGTKNIHVHDCLIMTRKSCFKIGTETHKPISDVLFENCESVNSSRGCNLFMRDQGSISNVTFKNIKLDLREYPGEGTSGAPFDGYINKRYGLGKVHDITFENIEATAPYAVGYEGFPDSWMENITFKNCSITITDRTDKMGVRPVFDLKYCRNFKFINFKINWKTPLTQVWNGFLKQENCEGIVVEGLEETR